MSLVTRLHTSRELWRSTLRVLRGHPRLLLFPLVSGLCTIALALFFFSPIIVLLLNHGWPDWVPYDGNTPDAVREQSFRNWASNIALSFYAYGVLIYLVSLIAAAFFNVAFYHQILRALGGETVSLANGMCFAGSRLRSILMWSLLAGTVGVIIRAIEERLGWLGRIVMGLIGAAWSVAAVFAIPVIVRRGDPNPLAVLRDSAATLKRTWGESVVGYAGIQIGGSLAIVLATAPAFWGAYVAVKMRSIGLLAMVGAGWLLALVAIGLFASLVTHIYRGALYLYASEGVVPSDFTAELMDAAWKVKKA